MMRIARTRRDCILVFVIAVVPRIGLALWLPADDAVFWDEPYRDYARNFAEGRGFYMGNPYGPELGIERVYAFRPPLFPLLWGCVYGPTGGAFRPIRVAHAILGAAACVVAYLAGREFIARRSPVLIGALLCALYPPLIWHSVHLMTEPLFIFLGTMCLYALLRARRKGGWGWHTLAGIAAGLGALSRSVLFGFLPLAALWLWCATGRSRQAVIRSVAFVGVALAVMSPWIVRNAVVLRAFVPTTTDLGHGFYVANNSGSLAAAEGFSVPEKWSFLLRPGEKRIDEVTASRRLVREAMLYLWTHKVEAAKLMLRRFLTLWRFYPNPKFVTERERVVVYGLSYVPAFTFMLIGLWLAHRGARRRLAGLLLVDLYVAYTVAIHTAILAMLRYRVPLMPFLLMFSGVGIRACWLGVRRAGTRRSARTSK